MISISYIKSINVYKCNPAFIDVRAIRGVHGTLIAIVAGLAIVGLSGTADVISIHLVTGLGDLVPLESEWEPQLPDHIGLTPYLHIEPPPNAMIAIGHDPSKLYLFRSASAGVTGIPAGPDVHVRLNAKGAWDNGEVYTFRGAPIDKLKPDATDSLYGLPWVCDDGGRFTNLLAGPQSSERFPSSPHPSGIGPEASRQNATSASPSGDWYLDADAATGDRTIVQIDDIPFGRLRSWV